MTVESVVDNVSVSGRYRGLAEHTVVDIVHVRQRIVGIVNDKRAAQAIAVLVHNVAMIPVRACARRSAFSVRHHELY